MVLLKRMKSELGWRNLEAYSTPQHLVEKFKNWKEELMLITDSKSILALASFLTLRSPLIHWIVYCGDEEGAHDVISAKKLKCDLVTSKTEELIESVDRWQIEVIDSQAAS